MDASTLNRQQRRDLARQQRKRTDGKAARTGRVRLDPVGYAIAGVRVAQDDQLNKLRTAELASIDAFATGQATSMDAANLEGMHDLAWTMAVRGVGVEVEAVCQTAWQHLEDTKARWAKTGKWGATGPALVAWRALFEYHDLQRTSISLGQYEQFIDLALQERRRVDAEARKAGS